MANTTIALRASGTAAATPSLGVIANGELSINYADGIIYYKTASNTLGSIRTTQPAGLTTEIQFNDAGSFGSNAALTYNKTTSQVNVTNLLVTSTLTTGSGVGGIIAGANVVYSNVFTANATTTSTSNSTGAIISNGGIGVKGNVSADGVNVATRVDWPASGYAPPSLTTRSSGTKLTLYPSLSSTSVDYAIGINGGVLWSSIPAANNTYSFKWYGGESEIASLSGDGKLTAITANITATTASTSNTTGALTVLGGVGVKGNVSVDGIIFADGTRQTTAVSGTPATLGDVLALSIALG